MGTGELWRNPPTCIELPLLNMRMAFERYGAAYCILWIDEGNGNWQHAADYITAPRMKALKNRRGDDKTFPSESKKYPPGPDSLIAKLAATGNIETSKWLDNAHEDVSFDRMKLAKEFGIKSVRLTLTESGVFEYGVPMYEQLAGNTLGATLKM